MLEVRSVTARGSGRAGGRPVPLALVTTDRAWTDSTGTRSVTRREYEVHAPRPVGDHAFDSEEAREEFLAGSFAELDLEDESWVEAQPGGHPLAGLLQARLDSVRRVGAGIDLRFGGLHLRLHALPDMHRDGVIEAGLSAGRLRSLVGRRLVAVDELLDLGLVLDFDDGTRLMLDLDGAQAPVASFSGNGHVWGPRSLPRAGDPAQSSATRSE
jgi:hypothetical protein